MLKSRTLSEDKTYSRVILRSGLAADGGGSADWGADNEANAYDTDQY
jgi:hypothetical protein